MIADSGPQVLLIISNEDLARQMSLDLKEAGYTPTVALIAAQGLEIVQKIQPALIVIDRMLGGDSGLALCQTLRNQSLRTPIVLLMARDTLEDRVACLEAGADDYFLKPYRSDAFLKLTQLYSQPRQTGGEQIRFGDLALDLINRTASRNGRTIDLTMKEFELLKYLMEHPREVLTREQILENVWGYDFMGESNVIEVYIRYLRLKIDGENEKRLIQTVRGVGYVLRES
ncbi:response regulator transcription factor NblR [Pseudanabaena sp. FACHB-2040]|uniref:response regulator transcription factor NblR n=1 Tax=Pseudanabaena sp. FACHB-2040 TaxID=2692859 RepID=UPI0016821593|nr:response regulator transcription factor [Pseudanabaena sp. FACHB-2040]MBD0269841.1 response regulator transcription factor [Cyanobacteria bacterium Co-bin8]MBD2259105.1 response regulator transcription factor [Pseudanabaena sp. FACHB-2040]